MGLLDPTLLGNLNKLKGLLGETPIGKYVRGQDQGVSVNGLKQALLGMPVFDQRAGEGDMAYAMDAMGPMPMAGVIAAGKYPVYHGTRAVKRWYDIPEYKAMMDEGKDIPRNVAESTYPIDSLRGGLGGLKMMDGLGPHAGTAAAANERIAKNAGLSPSKAFNKYQPELSDAYILPLEATVKKPFGPKNADAYTEAQLQARLSAMAKQLGFPADATRSFSSMSQNPKLRGAQKAVKEKLLSEGYDSIPYFNSHEDRGSLSWVFLDPNVIGFLGGK